MIYFSYNDFIDCTEKGEIDEIIKLEENIEKYELKDSKQDVHQEKNQIVEVLKNKIQMKKFLKDFLNLQTIGDTENLTYYNNIEGITEINEKVIYKIENKEIFILVKIIDELDYNISYKMFEDSFKIIQEWNLKEKDKNKRNTIVIPIVIYMGKENWKSKKINNILNYVTIEKNRVDFSYNIVNINQLNIKELKNMNCEVAKKIIKFKYKYLQIN